MFSDENGQNPVLDDNFGKDTHGWYSLGNANKFLENELKKNPRPTTQTPPIKPPEAWVSTPSPEQ